MQQSGRGLTLSADAAPGARIRCAVYSRKSVRDVTAAGRSVPFEWNPETGLARFEFTHTGDSVRVSF